MTKRLELTTLLIAASATASCVGAGRPAPEVSGSETGGVGIYTEGETVRDTFMVFWTVDYGYRFNPMGDQDTIVTPELEGEAVKREFSQFFSTQNLALHMGKKIYCECLGERYERYGAVFFRVREARLFAV
jgi:hypothetical protein